MDTYFIGYDAREHEAAAVCAYSIAKRVKSKSTIYLLEHRALRRLGLFNRTSHMDEKGQCTDDRDGKPFSTDFSHSRFLVFHLAKELGLTGPCAFLDCDFLFLSDPGDLMERQADNFDKIGVLMRDTGGTVKTKMDGMAQEKYPRKLWSAFFTFTPSQLLSEIFTPERVDAASGRDLHGFLGLPAAGFWKFGSEWHVIPTMDLDRKDAKAIHYSEFSPWINPERAKDSDWTKWAFEAWDQERAQMLKVAGHTGVLMHTRSLEADILEARAKKGVD